MTAMKTCVRCRAEKAPDEFQRRKKSSDGRKSHCKACSADEHRAARLARPQKFKEKDAAGREKRRERIRLYMSEYRTKNRDRINAVIRQGKEANPEKYLFMLARGGARDRGIDFELSVSDIRIPDVCPVLGIPLKKAAAGKRDWASPSVDRIDNSVGYIPGNVAVISYRANMIKSIGSAEEHEAIAKWMKAVSMARKNNDQ